MEGCILYHSIIKSIRGRVIFYSDVDRMLFLNILRRFVDKHKVDLVEFVLMANHIHLLHTAQSHQHAQVFVSEMEQNFSYWYNRLHSTHDKFFIPAKIYPKYAEEDIVKTSFYILQNPMVASQSEYPHPRDCKWSSYHYHYNFMDKTQQLVKKSADVFKANNYFDLINSSISVVKNKCPLLRSGFHWPDLKLSDFLDVNHFNLDRLYSRQEFEVLVQKSIVSKKEQYGKSLFKGGETSRHKAALSELYEFLSNILGPDEYSMLPIQQKDEVITQFYTFTKATPAQLTMLLDEDIKHVRKLYSELDRKKSSKKIWR